MGRHSVPDDYDDEAPAVLSAPPAPAGRPRPGRHTQGDRSEPQATPPGPAVEGLDVIETVMADDAVDSAEAVDADGPVIDDAFEAFEGHTEQIEPIVDPVLDEPLPAAVTAVLAPVVDGATAPPRPAPRLVPQPGAAVSAPGVPDDVGVIPAAPAAADTPTPAAPDTRMSDLALLRSDSAARARVIAAIVVPFVLYVGVLLVLDALDLRTVLIWIWVPLISAGVVAGLLLDLAHRAAAARAIAALEREPAAADTRDATGPIVQR